jgi:hypothetical protein
LVWKSNSACTDEFTPLLNELCGRWHNRDEQHDRRPKKYKNEVTVFHDGPPDDGMERGIGAR